MHEEMKKPDLTDLCELERRFIEAIKMETANGLYCKEVSIPQLGEVVDMLKDIIEAKKDCMKAYYYKTVTEAMENYEEDSTRYDYDDDAPMGYDSWRYSSGRYAPKGKGHRTRSGRGSGFMPEYMLEDMIYDPERRNITANSTGKMDGHDLGKHADMHMPNSRYGYSYDEYKHAKESGDKNTADSKARTHVGDMINTTREIWKDADPALKKSLKEDLSAFVTKEMVV